MYLQSNVITLRDYCSGWLGMGDKILGGGGGGGGVCVCVCVGGGGSIQMGLHGY